MIFFNNPVFDAPIIKASMARFVRDEDASMVRVAEDGTVLGGALYTEYNGHSVNMHVAGFAPNWLNRQLLRMAFIYPFEHLKVKKVIGTVPAANTRAIDFDKHLGFIEETRIRDVMASGDMVILGMYREGCRFLK